MRSTQNLASGGASALLLLASLAATSAHALDSKTFPASFCQSSGSGQTLYYSGGKGMAIANRTNSARSAICPIVRDNTAQPWVRLYVTGRDRSRGQRVTCVAHSTPRDATGGWAQSQGSGDGFFTLAFGAIGQAPGGVYSVVCQLPAMEANLPSYLTSYQLIEP